MAIISREDGDLKLEIENSYWQEKMDLGNS